MADKAFAVDKSKGGIFGILVNKWRILDTPLNVEFIFAANIIKACTILDNFAPEKDTHLMIH